MNLRLRAPWTVLVFLVAVHFVASAVRGAPWPDVFNPLRVRTIHVEIDPATWDAIRHDQNYNNCNTPGCDPALNIRAQCVMWDDEDPARLVVQIRRKSDPALPDEADPQKVSLKIDVNEYVTGQEWRGLKKISLENGNGGNGVLREAMGMQLHRMASEAGAYDYQAGYSAWVRLVVNGNYVGLYASPEQRDKQFLRNRGMYKPGASWLYELNPGTYLDTTVSLTNSPTFDHLCFSPFNTTCSQPANPTVAIAMERELEQWVDMKGMLTFGALEAFMANRDGLFTKNGKNSFFIDMLPLNQQKRRYVPWDLDSVLSSTTWDIYNGGAGGQRPYQTQILGHYWFREYYRHVFTDLLDGPISLENLNAFLDALEPVLKPYIDEDPNEPGGAAEFESLRKYFADRIANVRGQIGTVTGWPIFSRSGGEMAPGFELSLTHTNATGVIYYTLDGSDPRGLGGITNGQAFSGPIKLLDTTHVAARVKSGASWSALRRATFNVAGHAGSIKVTEIMYNPGPLSTNEEAGNLEFIEIQNTGITAADLSGCSFDGIGYIFEPGTTLAPGAFLVLVGNPSSFASRYPGVTCHDVFRGGLAKGGEKIRLRNSDGNNIFSVDYKPKAPWPLGADGMGYSLVNIHPAGDPDNPENWRASTHAGGSPRQADPEPPYKVGVVVNEVIAHTDTPLEDAIELYNPTDEAIDISGWFLSDENNTADPSRARLKKYRFPSGSIIPARGYLVRYESDFNPAQQNSASLIRFALSQYGEGAYLASANSAGELTGHIVGMEFGASDNGVSYGMHQTSTGPDLTFLSAHTFGFSDPGSKGEFRLGTGMANSHPRVGPVVISEIMYHPAAGGNEFIELQNISSTNVDLSGWSVKGAAFTFPLDVVLPPQGLLVLLGTTNISVEQFRSARDVPASVPILSHAFTLQNDGEMLELRKPSDPPGNPPILVDRVRYNDKSPWPTEADGEGPSLERFQVSAFGNEPLNWRTATPGGSPGRTAVFERVYAIMKGSSWKYHAEGHDLGAAWSAPGYSDSGWAAADALFAFPGSFGASGPPVLPVTSYFRKRFVISDPPAQVRTLTLVADFNDGFVAHLNGQEVLRRSMPGGSVAFSTLAAPRNSTGYEIFDLGAHIGKLIAGGNTLAVEVHQAALDDAELIWDAELQYSTQGKDPAPAPVLEASLLPSGLLLQWTTVPGATYRVQWSGTLQHWQDLSPALTADGVAMQYHDTNSLETARGFYRVLVD
jgi:hypothetical protein